MIKDDTAMIKIDEISFAPFTAVVTGNRGEEALSVTASFGLSGRIAYTILETGVDGSHKIRASYTFQDGHRSKQFTRTLISHVHEWQQGNSPRPLTDLVAEGIQCVREIAEHFGIDEDEFSIAIA
jgi:hypothetical protein